MTQQQMITIAIIATITLAVWLNGILLLSGRGAFLIPGFNKLTPEQKSKYNQKALCKFMGIIMMILGGLSLLFGIGLIFEWFWTSVVFIVGISVVFVFSFIYVNNSKKLRQKKRKGRRYVLKD